MESKWPMLCFYKNHWKAHTIATTNYPTWYHNCIRREVGPKDNDKGYNEPVTKKCKTLMEEASDASESSLPPKVQDNRVATPIDNIFEPPPSKDSMTRPRARALRNPL
jgi:hypothetical protein